MNEKMPFKLPRSEHYDLLLRRSVVALLSVVAAIIAFLCSCTGSGMALLTFFTPPLRHYDGVTLGVVIGLIVAVLTFIFAIWRFWPKDQQ